MALEELWGLSSSIDTTTQSSESSEKISDAMKEAVAQQAAKSKEIAKKIATSKAQHHAYANFLTVLLTHIKNDELISVLYKLFFTTKDPYHGTVYVRKSSNYPVLIGLFVPFLRDKVIEYKMQSLYDKLRSPNTPVTTQSYLHYLKKLAHAMHDNIALDQSTLMQCIILILEEFSVIRLAHLEDQQLQELKSLIQKELY